MGDRQGWGGEWARRKGIPCRGQHQQMQAGDQHSTCRKAEAAGVAGGIPGGHSAKLGEQQGWALYAGLRQQRPLRILNGGFYKAYSSWGEVIINGRKGGRETSEEATVCFKGPELEQWY